MKAILRKLCLVVFIAALILFIIACYERLVNKRSAARMESLFASAKGEEFLPALEVNPDTAALLEYGEGTRMFVPSCKDNEYYLTHDFFGDRTSAGCAFIDARCAVKPFGRHTLVHGHNMRTGEVFGALHRFIYKSNVAKTPFIRFDTPTEKRTYVIFAVLEISLKPNHPAYFKIDRLEFESDEEFAGFINEIQAASKFDFGVPVDARDTLLSLSTCLDDYPDGRLIVTARALRSGETTADLESYFK